MENVPSISSDKIEYLPFTALLYARNMTHLFSYVVDHDHGYVPNPYDGVCTLFHCKYGGFHRRRNIVEMVEVDDWILGSGGSSKQSAGVNKII